MKRWIKAITGQVLVLIILAASCTSVTQSTSSTSTYDNKINTVSSASANGLSLSLSLDMTTYKPGQDVSITVDVKNTWPETNHVPVADNWPYSDLASGQCDLGAPYGIAIFQGDYTSANFSAITPLALWDYGLVVPCPVEIPLNYYVFEPLSDIATAFSSEASFPNFTEAINFELTATGYWTGTRPTVAKHNFAPGVYTVAAGDEWGALVVLHFTVT
jgi:hypothetical protein